MWNNYCDQPTMNYTPGTPVTPVTPPPPVTPVTPVTTIASTTDPDPKPSAVQKVSDVIDCTASTASQLSVAGMLGVNSDDHPFLTALLGNAVSGAIDTGRHVAAAFTGSDKPASAAQVLGDVVAGGVTMGVPVGEKLGMLGGGIMGAAQDAVINGLASLGEAAETASMTAADAFSYGKLVFDGAVFLGSMAYCGSR